MVLLHVSKRGIEEFGEAVSSSPESPWANVSNLKREMIENSGRWPTLRPRQRSNRPRGRTVDETGWKRAGIRVGCGKAATAVVACFVIAPTRGAAGLAALLGQKIKGIISSDRWSVYGHLKLGLRQLCWAHPRWTSQKPIDPRGGQEAWGDKGLGSGARASCFTNGTCSAAAAAGRTCNVSWDRCGTRSAVGFGRRGRRCRDAQGGGLVRQSAGTGAGFVELPVAAWSSRPTTSSQPSLRPAVAGGGKNAYCWNCDRGRRLDEAAFRTVVQTRRLQSDRCWSTCIQEHCTLIAAASAPTLLGDG